MAPVETPATALFDAIDSGNLPTLKRLISQDNVSLDQKNELDLCPLHAAIAKGFEEIVRLLLDNSDLDAIYQGLEVAFTNDDEAIAELIVKHPRFPDAHFLHRRRLEECEDDSPEDLPAIVTAAQLNFFNVTEKLLELGDTIEEPHNPRCLCSNCSLQQRNDLVHVAKNRLETYRGLASPAYIVLTSVVPFTAAMDAKRKIMRVAGFESHYKNEYTEIVELIDQFIIDLLDQINTSDELVTVLNRTREVNRFEDMFLLKHAVNHEEREFVAHPLCQQMVRKVWYKGCHFYEKGTLVRLLLLLFYIASYPIFVLAYFVAPDSRMGRFVQRPFIKFLMSTTASLNFLLIVVITTVTFAQPVDSRTLADYEITYQHFERFTDMLDNYNLSVLRDPYTGPNVTKYVTIDSDFYNEVIAVFENADFEKLRPHRFMFDLWMIQFFMIIGFVLREMKQVYADGLLDYLRSNYNWFDFIGQMLYLASYALMAVTFIMVQHSLKYFEDSDAWINLLHKNKTSWNNLYWLNSDRWFWHYNDPMHLRDGLYSVANVLSFMRVSQVMVVSDSLGPMQISLGKMIKNIVLFCCILVLIMVAFIVSIMNLYWYYNHDTRELVELTEHGDGDINAQEHFGTMIESLKTLTWAMLGLAESDWYSLHNYGESWAFNADKLTGNIIQDFGFVLWALYHVAIVVVMLNMLIAMMSQTFEQITGEADVEWKFARTELFMEYIGEGGVLPSPINLIPNPVMVLRGVYSVLVGLKHRGSNKVRQSLYVRQPVIYRNAFGLEINRCEDYHLNSSDLKSSKATSTDPKRNSGLITALAETKYANIIERLGSRYIAYKNLKDGASTGSEITVLKNDLDGFQTQTIASIDHVTSVVTSDSVKFTRLLKLVDQMQNQVHENTKQIVGLVDLFLDFQQVMNSEIKTYRNTLDDYKQRLTFSRGTMTSSDAQVNPERNSVTVMQDVDEVCL